MILLVQNEVLPYMRLLQSQNVNGNKV